MTASAQDLIVDIGETWTIDRQSRRFNNQERFLQFATINLLATGELVVGVWMTPDENYMEGAFEGYRISRDHGRSWSRRHTKGQFGWCKHPFADGSMLELSYLTALDPPEQRRECVGVLSWFSEGGAKISQEEFRIYGERDLEPEREPWPLKPGWNEGYVGADGNVELPVMSEVYRGPSLVRELMEMPEGHLMATMNPLYEGDHFGMELIRSEDRGKTWYPFSTFGGSGAEPAMVQLANGDLFTIYRIGGPMPQCWSRDGGQTWSEPVSSGASGVLPKLLLLSNGILACSYGRPGIHLMFSVDGSVRKWSHHQEISPVDSRGSMGDADPEDVRFSTCYTDMVEIEPGRILLLWDTRGKHERDVRLTTISVTLG